MNEEKNRKTYIVEDPEKIWFEYDRQSDTLYIHMGSEEEPEETILVGEDIIIAVKNNRIISLTVLNFTRRIGIEF
ncbi:MAG: DUF2283 domain-containing protein [Sulfolobales archaeon]